MIVVERKPIEDIQKYIAPYKSILLAGCGACAAVCFGGGEKEVEILASQLKLLRKKEGKEINIIEKTVKRQCEKEFVKELKEDIERTEAVLSLACGAGIQFIAAETSSKPVYPGVNTKFLGGTEEPGVWKENCQSCGDCILDKTGGVCPITRCSKSLLNGPCGGSQDGKCEVDKDIECAWQLICDRMNTLGCGDELMKVQPIKNWSKSRDGGPRKVVREDLRLS